MKKYLKSILFILILIIAIGFNTYQQNNHLNESYIHLKRNLTNTQISKEVLVKSETKNFYIPATTYTAPDGYKFNKSGQLVSDKLKTNEPLSTTLNDSEGYLTMTTTVYQDGMYGIYNSFHTIATVEMHKKFYLRNTDYIIICNGPDGEINPDKSLSGFYNYVLHYDDDVYENKHYTTNISKQADETKNDFSYVQYSFKLAYNGGSNAVKTTISDEKFTVDYYFYAKDYTGIRLIYIHNEKFFGGSLSINIGPFSYSPKIGGGNTEYDSDIIGIKF